MHVLKKSGTIIRQKQWALLKVKKLIVQCFQEHDWACKDHNSTQNQLSSLFKWRSTRLPPTLVPQTGHSSTMPHHNTCVKCRLLALILYYMSSWFKAQSHAKLLCSNLNFRHHIKNDSYCWNMAFTYLDNLSQAGSSIRLRVKPKVQKKYFSILSI